jgi:hypothetical protein
VFFRSIAILTVALARGAPAATGAWAQSSREVTVTGTLTGDGVECPAMKGDDGALYTLAGDLGSFGPEDRVRVTGEIAGMSLCMQGTTIQVEAIGPAP